ncbi:MAG: tRNA-dihydrouridine synthase family protein, partial [Gemmataceae bacterium]|nr:tRNA-dihydrouridine synthase family protein [Gemmataceae bacterium]
MIDPDRPALVLAPMEGVTDAPMRAVQGLCGAFTHAVTEFLRVSHAVPPKHVFRDHAPELDTQARTLTGLPVQLQLLGGDPDLMAASAARAHELGATAIDLNFGCPAPTVNRHDGGAALLRHPKRIRHIVRAVRDALPPSVPVSAKLRLGWDSTDPIRENAGMAAEGGAAWITIHGRTRVAGYAPPIFWEPIGEVRERLGIPVVANGDIWTPADFRRCREVTGCRHFMLGRSALANPRFPRWVATELGLLPRDESTEPDGPFDWVDQLRELVAWSRRFDLPHSGKNAGRLKQWLRLASQFGDFPHFDRIKRA